MAAMTVNSVVKLNQILKDQIQEYLAGSEAVLVKTIMDLSPRVSKGMDRVTIPRVSGLSFQTVVPGTKAVGSGMTTTGDSLLLDQIKEVPDFIHYDDDQDSAVDLKSAFLSAAPKEYAQGIELAINDALAATNTAQEAVSTTAGVFDIDDIGAAKTTLDKAGVPKSDRYMALNADSMEKLAAFTEFQEGRSLVSQEGLVQGIVSRVKGFNVVQSEDVGTTTPATNYIHLYHRSACAFAMQDGVRFIEKVIEESAEEFISLRGKFGVKVLDTGKRNIKLTLTTSA